MSQHPPAATVVCNLTTRHYLATSRGPHTTHGRGSILFWVLSPRLFWPGPPGPSLPSQHCPSQISTTLETRYSLASGSCPVLSCPVTVRPPSSSSQTRLPSCPDLPSGDASDHCEAYPFKVFCSVFSTRVSIRLLLFLFPPPSSSRQSLIWFCPGLPHHPSVPLRRHCLGRRLYCTNTTLRLDSFRYSRTGAAKLPFSRA